MATLDPGTTGKRRRGTASKTKKNSTGLPTVAAKSVTDVKTHEPPVGSPFMTIPTFGKRFFGLSKNGSYDAAERGDFGKLVKIGRRKFVAVAAAEAKAKGAIAE